MIFLNFLFAQESPQCFQYEDKNYLSVNHSSFKKLALEVENGKLVSLGNIEKLDGIKCPNVKKIEKNVVAALKELGILDQTLKIILKIE